MIRLKMLAAIILVGAIVLPVAGSQAANGDSQGFIYGTITTTNDKQYTGFMRWDDEEVCWDDLFHSAKKDLPVMDDYADEIEDAWEDSHRGRRSNRGSSLFKVFKWSFSFDNDNDKSRIFIARFGDIARIEPYGSDGADVTMKNGSRYEVSGYSNDVTGKIFIQDDDLGDVGLKWNRIESIEFFAVPRNADSGFTRLSGHVKTDSGDFEGFIQWDKEECLASDLLDGDSDDGDVSLKMGRIRSIERRNSRSCEVTLKDGRSMRLSGSNDVNDDNRGIVVEDKRVGRVTIPWDEFEELVFTDGNSGRGYDDFPELGELKGRVVDDSGHEFSGRIVFDADESEAWEILNGSSDGIEYDIPFVMIKSIEPLGRDECRVVLLNGEELELEGSPDVSDRNCGIFVFSRGNRDPEYVPWDNLVSLVLSK